MLDIQDFIRGSLVILCTRTDPEGAKFAPLLYQLFPRYPNITCDTEYHLGIACAKSNAIRKAKFSGFLGNIYTIRPDPLKYCYKLLYSHTYVIVCKNRRIKALTK